MLNVRVREEERAAQTLEVEHREHSGVEMIQEGESREYADLAGQAATEHGIVGDSPGRRCSGQQEHKANERALLSLKTFGLLLSPMLIYTCVTAIALP
jgi:hypothetical protein